MSQFFAIHPDNPEARRLRQATSIVKAGGLIVYPTDSGYALACQTGNISALTRIFCVRELEKNHPMTLVCRELSLLHRYIDVSPSMRSLIKANTPGAYTFILNTKRSVKRLLCDRGRKTLGFRIPNHRIALSLLEHYDAPLVSTTLILPNAIAPLSQPEAIRDLLGQQVDLIIDGGACSYEPTSVIDLTTNSPRIIREGKGDVTFLGYTQDL